MKRMAIVGGAVVVALALYVGDQAVRALRALDKVERERDTWQRPDDVIKYLDVRSGQSVVDLRIRRGLLRAENRAAHRAGRPNPCR